MRQFATKSIKLLVQQILEQPLSHGPWTLQGFGMLRMYLAFDLRLHVWDSRYKVEDVSEMHDHPWAFNSFVVAGVVENIRFDYSNDDLAEPFKRQTILCGEGGGLEGGPEDVWLVQHETERYSEGMNYRQSPREIHVSKPYLGTVTLIERQFEDDPDHAHVFWTPDKEWVTAEPRPAASNEVLDITRAALGAWFDA